MGLCKCGRKAENENCDGTHKLTDAEWEQKQKEDKK